MSVQEIVARYGDTLATETDRDVLRLILEGERREDEFSRILGFEGKDTTERKRAVKQAKDRIKARIRRAGRREG